MRILFLTHRIPYPPNKGDKIRAFHILGELASRHEVVLATLVDDPADLAGLPALQALVSTILHARIDQPGRRALSASALLHNTPITLKYFYSRHLQSGIDRLIDEAGVDAVFCSSSPMGEYVLRSRHRAILLDRVRSYMDLIDIDSCKWRQYASQSPWWRAWIYRYEARVLASYERQLAGQFDHLLVVSPQERELFPGGPTENLHAIANGVDLQYFSPSFVPTKSLDGPALVFTGVMDYWPNVEGIRWFVEHIWASVRRDVPAARLYIVGSRPASEVQRLAEVPGITVTGFVPDVREYIASARLCIAPLRVARGIQNKVLEAMAMGKAVVASAAAYEGLQAREGADLVVADDEYAFAREVVALLGDGDRAARIGSSARACVESHYSWSRNLAGLRDLGL